jgi:hypothetical protein
MDDKPVVITVPTSLKRIDPFWHLFAALVAVVVSKGLVDNYHMPWLLLVPPQVAIALWSLTSEEAADMRYVGWLAAVLRSRLGQRRIDEWARAIWHYWRVAAGPRLKERCSARLESSRRATTVWLAMASAWTRSKRLPGSLWALPRLSSSLRRPAK